ncbi:MAG: glycosyltransferase family 39 protein [Bdellovibrionales bacterium]|nr:glycosyltransferase family 39 protein [Bdellovibrionales bacterium]
MKSRSFFNKDFVLLTLILILAFLVRLDFLIASNFAIDADEAIVGLMAKHALEGKQLPVFYYGQHYMGSFEPWLVSLTFQIFGVSVVSLKMIPLVFSLILLLLIYCLTCEVADSKTARIAALLTAIPPSTLVIWSTKARGGFIELMCIGALALLIAVYWLKQKNPRLTTTVIIGLILGFGWWVNNQIVYFIAPIGLMFLYHSLTLDTERKFKKTLEYIIFGSVGFIFGGILFWGYNLQNDFVSFQMFSSSNLNDVLDHIEGLFSTAIPILLGAKRFWQTQDVFPYATFLAYVVYSFVLLYPFVVRRKFFTKGLFLLGFFLDFVFIIFVTSSFGWLVEAPRYLLPAYIGIFVLTAVGINSIGGSFKILSRCLFGVLLALNLLSCYYTDRAIPGEPFVFKGERVSKDHRDLIKFLQTKKISWVRTNYWIGYRLAFETSENIKFLVFQEPGQTRIYSYLDDLKKTQLSGDLLPLVLVPAQEQIVGRALELLGYSFSKGEASGYVIFYNIEAPKVLDIIPDNVISQLNSSDGQDTIQAAFDNDVHTRWATARHQEKGMWFKVIFNGPQTIEKISMLLGEWKHDYPRGLTITAELENGIKQRLLSNKDYWYVRYYLEGNAGFDFNFKPVKVKSLTFIQTSEHPILDWSIAELNFYN